MNIVMFDNVWYHQMIDRVREQNPDASPDATINAVATMTGCAFIAEAIASALGDIRGDGNVPSSMSDAAAALVRIADALEARGGG